MALSWIAAVLPSGGVRSGREGDDAETLIKHHNVSLVVCRLYGSAKRRLLDF